jgi:flagellar hook-associated protein 2
MPTGSIDGLVSGLNTTEIVDSIMAFERRPADLLEAEQAEKTNIISAYKALQAKFLALSTELSRLARPSTWEASSIQVSDESYLTATSSGRLNTGSYDVQVLSLARNHQLASQGFVDQSQALFGTGAITIQVGDASARTITIDANSNSLTGIARAINNARMGVTASIVNDGSDSNPYRLVLAADKSGLGNQITVTSALTGGLNLNYDTASFDMPELLAMNNASTAQVSLGSTASYTGAENKIYTFTVEGTGEQTIGTDPITINWSDGTNSGSIIVTQADTEVELAGVGADGLKLNFSAGTLTGGDTFQVSTFAPTLQQASNARISLGSQGGAGSPIVVTSDSNTFSNLIGGLSLTVKKETQPGDTVTISTDIDIDGIRQSVQSFISKYNDVVGYIDKQNEYNQDSKEAGILFGDSTLWMMRNELSSAIGNTIAGLNTKFSQLYAIGIRTKSDGQLAITDASRFEDALRNNLDEVISLMSSDGSSNRSGIEFVSSTTDTVAGRDYDVNITRAATVGYYEGSRLDDPGINPIEITSSNNTLKLKVDGLLSSELYLTARDYTSGADLAGEIQSKIDADENLGPRGITVEWIDDGNGGGHLKISSANYGSTSRVELVSGISSSAYTALGLSSGESVAGVDVEGTINGETAEGVGQTLRGKDDSKTIKGLVLRITLTQAQLVDGIEGAVTVTKGVAARTRDVVASLTRATDGTLDRRISSYQKQVDNIAARVTEIDDRLALRRESLLKKFYAMEEALSSMNTTSQFLTAQLAGINSNWALNRTSKNG